MTIPGLSEREASSWRALQVMQARLETALSHQLTVDSGLSHPDFLVLAALTDDPGGRLRLFELGDLLGWEKSRVSHHVTRMVTRGFVKKVTCPSDRRGAFVAVTARGHRAFERAAPRHAEAVRRLVIDRLTPGQLDAVGDAAEVILAALDELSMPATPVRSRR